MRRSPLALLLLAFGLNGFGQASPDAPATVTTPKVDPSAVSSQSLVTVTPNSTPARPREVSPAISANINSTLPKFSPPSEAEAKKADEPPDLRETDKPRNGIVRLPKYIVQERKEPVFKDREILTPKGKLELAYKRHPGLRFGSLPFLNNNGIALAMLEEERRLERKAEKEELESLYRYSDPKAGAALKRETKETFIRHDGP